MSVDALDGVRPKWERALTSALATCSNGERLAVCLYFMSDLHDSWHHLSDIEKNLRRMFPASAQGNHPDDYHDFQAATMRAYFNHEKRENPPNRLWKNIRRGHWRNTEVGNQYALDTLRRRQLLIEVRGAIVNQRAQELPPRSYLR